MEPALKQRLIGAAVLVAIAVIFLPMLIKGPAPESGISDVPLDIPDTPQGQFETRELPLVTPSAHAGGSVTGMEPEPVEGGLPTVDTRAGSGMFPAATAGGGYAVSFGSYATAADAQRVVDALLASQLPGYQETAMHDGRTLHRVRIGPFDTRATAEAARLRAAHVRDDVGSRVLAIDGGEDHEEVAGTPVATAVPAPDPAPAETTALPETPAKPVAKAPGPKPEPAVAPAAPKPPPASTPAPPPAAAGVGFAVQLGAFSNVADANALRDRARAAGLSAFVQSVQTDKGTLTRVQVGPVADRDTAERLKAQVAAKLGINGFVHAHP